MPIISTFGCFALVIDLQFLFFQKIIYSMVTNASSHQQKAQTPLQNKKIFLLGMILIANNTSMWMIFSFLPFMVKYYYPLIPEQEFGYKSGMLGAAYSAGKIELL